MIKLGNESSIVLCLKDDFIDIIVGNTRKIKLKDTIPLEKGLCEDGIILDTLKISDILLKYFGEHDIKEKEISFVVFGSDVVSRYLEIPKMKNLSLRKTVEFELKELLVNEEDYYIDYEVINEKKVEKTKVLDVLVAACTKTKIDKMIELSNMLSKKVAAIDILTNTINKVIQKSNLNLEEETIATFYFGYTFCNVSITDKGIFKLDRNIPFGFKNIIKDIQKYREEAGIDTKKNLEFYSRDLRIEGNNVDILFKMYPKLEETFNQFLSIVNKTIKFYSSGKGEKVVNKMIIFSTLDLSESEIKYISRYFDIETLLVRNPSDIGIKIKNSDNKYGRFMPLYGLFLKRHKNKKRLNLNPKAIEESLKDKESRNLLVIYIAVILVLIINAGTLYFDNVSLRDESSNLKEQISNLKERSEGFTEIKDQIESKKQFIDKVSALDSKFDFKDYIGNISKYVPQGISVQSATYNRALITLNGYAKTKEDVAVFLANLQMSKDYKNAEVLSINTVEETENSEVKAPEDVEKIIDKKESKDKEESKDKKDDTTKIEDIKKAIKEAKAPKTIEKIEFIINIKE